MTVVRDHFNYRRQPKTPPTSRRSSGRQTFPDTEAASRLDKSLTPEQREAILLRTAKAARAPIYVEPMERVYEVQADPMAVRRNNLGLKYLEHDLTKAYRNFLDAVEIDDTLALAHNNLGIVLLEIGEVQAAVSHFDRAIALDEALDIAYGNRGLARLELSQFAEAYRDLRTALELDPEDGMHYNNAGVLFLDLAEPEAAAEYFSEAIRLAPGEPTAYLNRGIALVEMGQRLNAKRDFRKATEIEEAKFATLSTGT